jgi:hypothetical protein
VVMLAVVFAVARQYNLVVMLAVVFVVARQYCTCGDACCGVCSGQAVQHLW